ncbi:hypothetical protein LTR09_008753 [Extremus antarcticus]|uniref:Uncharacterized protein n=1 Tax=Extremus antarcticus TaxID=702011 RepID=A0AAJ0DH85_9PEZI|nr:hypothetical protein LTR09_008753 [Extremus antarcticus]
MESTDNVNAPSGNPEDFLESTIEFPDGSQFERLHAITDFRKDPGEARILYLCKRVDSNGTDEDRENEYVMKIKAQWPGPQNLLHAGPSPFTAAELKVLRLFGDQKLDGVPHLVTWKQGVQSKDGVHPGGYLIYIVMTLVPGRTLWDLGYWSLTDEERLEIQQAFISKLNEVRQLGIAPYDCALRNVLWDAAQKRASIVDFEHYRETAAPIDDETLELQRWGLKSRPVPGTWYVEWGLKAKEAAEIGIVSS